MNLATAEVDENFYDLDTRVVTLEDETLAAVNQIASISVIGSQMTITMEDATTFGPFTLPQAAFRPAITENVAVDSSGTYTLLSTDANKYKRFDDACVVLIEVGNDMVRVTLKNGRSFVIDIVPEITVDKAAYQEAYQGEVPADLKIAGVTFKAMNEQGNVNIAIAKNASASCHSLKASGSSSMSRLASQ